MWFHLNGQLFWLTSIPYWVLLATALKIRARRGFGIYLAVAAVALLLLSDLVHWMIYQQTNVPTTDAWQEGGGFVYGLAMTLYQAFPMGLLYVYSRCNDNSIKKHGHVVRGRFNPHELAEHNGKRWLVLATVSFIIPFGLLTGPLGVTHTWWRMHEMEMGRVNPRGRGLLALAQAIFAMSWLSGYFLLAVATCGFQFYSTEILTFFDLAPVLLPVLDSALFYFPAALMAISFWLAMGSVAFYRRSYSPWALVGQLISILFVCGGIGWQVICSEQDQATVSPAVEYPLQGILLVVFGWVAWTFSLALTHQVPKLEPSSSPSD